MKDIHFLDNLMSKEESLSMAVDLLINSLKTKNAFTLSQILSNAKKETIMFGNSIELGEVNPPRRLMEFWDKLTPVVKEITGNHQITESSGWCRIYQNGSRLKRHLDREGLDWSITVPLYCNLEKEWPIYIEKEDKEIISFGNKIGSGVLFRSTKLSHWREDLVCDSDKFSLHLFLHWKIM